MIANTAKAGAWGVTKAVLKTMTVDAIGSGAAYLTGEALEELGLPEGTSTVLAMLVSGAVTYSAGKYFFKDAAGNVVGEYTGEELDRILKGELGHSPDIPPVKGSVADELLEGGGNSSFTWKLRGEDVTLTDVMLQEVSYVKRDPIELNRLRGEFNSTERATFLENLGQNAEYLRSAGFSDTDILKIQNGRVPDGWQVHHKLPLDDSGTNSFDNLVLVQNEPYHKVITNYQNSVTKQLQVGDELTVQWPMLDGNIYPPKH